MLELAILGLLKDQPLHGYELKKRLGESLGVLWGVSYGSLYPALRRLDQGGAIVEVPPAGGSPKAARPSTGSVTGDVAAARRRLRGLAGSGRRTRKAYRITEAGEVRFLELFTDDAGSDEERGFALRLSLFAHVPVQARLAVLERRRAELDTRLAALRAGRTTTGRDRYAHSLAQHRARSIERDLEWVEELVVAEQSAADDDNRKEHIA
ncbi:MAG TPA: PadR family transcriptional regulator [Acidimicrobiia bacterium]|nr:PadR family transcriptional regulator [Acidimicrobiia bacterium]